MRLTLRTMLAYLDETLEPEDAQVLGKKIEDSEFATNVVHRIRDVMRRLRLGAPAVSGRNSGVDPNTVAEYIDNTLTPDRVPDLEKLCLESDMHLAEVAACHQILTLVLRAPADVTAQSRQRMYRLIQDDDSAEEAATETLTPAKPVPAVNGHATATTSAHAPARKKPEIPEYLKAQPGRERFWRVAAAVLLSVLLVAVILMAAMPLGVGSWWSSRRPGKITAASTTKPHTPNESSVKPVKSSIATHAPTTKPGKKKPTTGKTADRSKPGRRPGLRQPDNVASSDKTKSPVNTGTDASSTPPEGDSDGATGETAAALDGEADGAPPAPAADSVGRLISINPMLLAFVPQSGEWKRLPAQQALFPGDKLLSLPAFRSPAALANGVQLQLVGEAQIELDPPDDQGVPKVYMAYGRAVLLTVGMAPTRIVLHLGDRMGTAIFEDAESALAVEVRPMLKEGANPADAQQVAVDLYATKGRIVWDEQSTGERLTLEAPARRTLGQAPDAAAPAGAVPSWVAIDELSPTEKKAAETLVQELPADAVATSRMLELAGHRRIEVCALAVRCLAAMGQYEPLVDALRNEAHHASWSEQVDCLRNAVARGPEAAQHVLEAFKRRRGPEKGDLLYRMLWGYTEQELRKDAARTLVANLDHDDLDFRVLAFWNLRHITGYHLFYRPEYTASKRQKSLQKWKQQLEAGRVVPKSLEPPATISKPAAGPGVSS